MTHHKSRIFKKSQEKFKVQVYSVRQHFGGKGEGRGRRSDFEDFACGRRRRPRRRRWRRMTTGLSDTGLLCLERGVGRVEGDRWECGWQEVVRW